MNQVLVQNGGLGAHHVAPPAQSRVHGAMRSDTWNASSFMKEASLASVTLLIRVLEYVRTQLCAHLSALLPSPGLLERQIACMDLCKMHKIC